MHPFDYVKVDSVAEAVALLAEAGGRARPLVGGTDVLVQLRARRKNVDRLIDIKGIRDTEQLTLTDEGLTLGASVACQRAYDDERVAGTYQALADSAALIGSIQIQNRASIGGNLCNAAPSADSIPALIVHKAHAVVASQRGRRRVAVEDFCVGRGRTCLDDDELLVSLELPPTAPRSGSAYARFTPRNEMDIAVVGVGASVVFGDDDETVVDARIALAAVAPTPLLVAAASDALIGNKLSTELVNEVARLARDAARPITDARGTEAQRRHLVEVLTRRVLWDAVQRARGAPPDVE